MKRLSIIIPAYNEEKYLPAALSAVNKALEGTTMPGEVIVVDNNSTDRTAAIAAEYKTNIVFEPINQISRSRNTGAKNATGDYLFFVDADTVVTPSLLNKAIDNLSSGNCCGGGATVILSPPLGAPHRFGLRMWTQISVHLKLAAGCFKYCLKEAFEDVGGFSEKVYAGEEIWLSGKLRRWGKARGLNFEIIQSAPVVTSARKLAWYGDTELLRLTLAMVLFPIISRDRRWCRLWYERPGVNKKTGLKV